MRYKVEETYDPRRKAENCNRGYNSLELGYLRDGVTVSALFDKKNKRRPTREDIV